MNSVHKRTAIDEMIAQDQSVLSHYDLKGKRVLLPISEVRSMFKEYISKRRPFEDYLKNLKTGNK